MFALADYATGVSPTQVSRNHRNHRRLSRLTQARLCLFFSIFLFFLSRQRCRQAGSRSCLNFPLVHQHYGRIAPLYIPLVVRFRRDHELRRLSVPCGLFDSSFARVILFRQIELPAPQSLRLVQSNTCKINNAVCVTMFLLQASRRTCSALTVFHQT